MLYRWEARCKFQNSFMQEDGRKHTITVTAGKESEARRRAQLEMCKVIGISTMMHGGVKIQSIKSLGR